MNVGFCGFSLTTLLDTIICEHYDHGTTPVNGNYNVDYKGFANWPRSKRAVEMAANERAILSTIIWASSLYLQSEALICAPAFEMLLLPE